MSAIASSSRTMISRSARLHKASAVLSAAAARRGFASSSVAAQRVISVRIAHMTTTLRLPSLPAWVSDLIGAFDAPAAPMPALAGLGSMNMEATSSASETDPLNWDGRLYAVPKQRTSYSKKHMRSSQKFLRDRVDLCHCPACGKPKLAFHICQSCFTMIARAEKAVIKQEQAALAMEVADDEFVADQAARVRKEARASAKQPSP